MKILSTFLVLMLLTLSNIGLAAPGDILVQQAPEYPEGDSGTITMETVMGIIQVEVVSQGLVQKRNGVWTKFHVVAHIAGQVVFEGLAFQEQGKWNGNLTWNGTMYRSFSKIKFPLREGDSFTNYLMASGPCSADRSQTCMNVTMQEHCHSVRRVSEGISITCDGTPGGRIRYVMDIEFRWPVSFEVLN